MANTPSMLRARVKLERQSAQHRFCLDVDCELPDSGVTAIFGASGSGKTTFLRCIAGLERPGQGEVVVAGQAWQQGTSFTPAYQRSIGYVFQEASLFEHLTAKGNLLFAMKRADQKVSDDYYQEVISLLGLETLLQRFPIELSGGERQRVAIARALLIQPKLLLMDEPLASLDQARRQEILPYLARLREVFAIPILYVTHSIDEIVQLADHVLVLQDGKQIAEGELTEVLSQPDLPMFTGFDAGTIWQGQVIERSETWHLAQVECAQGVSVWGRDTGISVGQTLRIRILARDVSITLEEATASSILNKISAKVLRIDPDLDEAMLLVRLQCDVLSLTARITKRSAHELDLSIGQQVVAQVKSVALVC